MKYIVLLGLVSICAAQVPVPCESPKQWEGRRVLIDSSKKFQELSRIFYDEIGMRVRTIEEIEYGTERNFYDVLHLYREGKEYRVDIRTKKCNVTALTRPFRPIGVPMDAKFLFEAEIGAAQVPNEHFTAVTFGGNYTTDNVRYMTTVTYPDCVPVADNYYNSVTGFVESRYFDIKGGISDPDAFLPPQVCM